MHPALEMLTPNRTVSKGAVRTLVFVQVSAALIIWALSSFALLPKPVEILHALQVLWSTEGLGQELLTSFFLNLETIAIATLVSLVLAYAYVLPFFRPIIAFISKLRFLSLAGLTFVFTLMTSSGHQLKLSLLVFSVSVFFVTGMADVITQIPKEKYDLARTLRMGDWEIVWEVIILGKIDAAFDVLRQNAAIGWMMLTMVEGMVRSEGGIGALLLNQNKHFHLDAVFAIQITILILGLLQDYLVGLMKSICCPYADLVLEHH